MENELYSSYLYNLKETGCYLTNRLHKLLNSSKKTCFIRMG